MTKSTPAKLAFQKSYNAQPQMVKRREANNLARKHAVKDGKVHVGDGRDVAHIVALDSGGSHADSNTKVESAHANRGWRAGESGYKVGIDK
jgi:hypothetical protein